MAPATRALSSSDTAAPAASTLPSTSLSSTTVLPAGWTTQCTDAGETLWVNTTFQINLAEPPSCTPANTGTWHVQVELLEQLCDLYYEKTDAKITAPLLKDAFERCLCLPAGAVHANKGLKRAFRAAMATMRARNEGTDDDVP